MNTSKKRIAPWVGYMSLYGREGSVSRPSIRKEQGGYCYSPVVVTPLMPGDPKVGEVWLGITDRKERTITSAPYLKGAKGVVSINHNRGVGWDRLSSLVPAPVTKTYKIKGTDVTITAENKEAAAAQLVESLVEEVK